MKHEGLEQAAAALGVNLSPTQIELLQRYEELLERRAAELSMIARSDLSRLRDRHVLDSLRAGPVLPDAGRVLDLGSGAGLPGIPVAIARPELWVSLSETRHQWIAFLELVIQELSLPNVDVQAGRAEEASGPFEACLARAFRDAPASWRVAQRLLTPEGCLVYFAGARFDLARDVPAGVLARPVPTSPLANAGPLVIMTRQ